MSCSKNSIYLFYGADLHSVCATSTENSSISPPIMKQNENETPGKSHMIQISTKALPKISKIEEDVKVLLLINLKQSKIVNIILKVRYVPMKRKQRKNVVI